MSTCYPVRPRLWLCAAVLISAAGFPVCAQTTPRPPAPTAPPPPASPTPPAATQPADEDEDLSPYEGRVIRGVLIQKPVPKSDPPAFQALAPEVETLVRNQLRAAAGSQYRQRTISEDISRVNRLGRFRRIESRAELQNDGSVILIYTVIEQPVITDIQSAGNRQISDQDIAKAISERIGDLVGTPVDPDQIARASRRIEELYRSKGYYLAQVSVDQTELEDSGILLFRIREGERVRVTDIRFDGARSFQPRELRTAIKTRTAGIFERGQLDDDTLDTDVTGLVNFYRDRGYLDVRADRVITPSLNGREAIVTFVIDEGPVYTLRSVQVRLSRAEGAGGSLGRFDSEAEAREKAGPEGFVEARQIPAQPGAQAGGPRTVFEAFGPGVFTPQQIVGLMSVKPGDVYAVNLLNKSVDAVRNAYGQLGYVDATVDRQEIRDTDSPRVDLLLLIREGSRFKTGQVIIRGNELTRQDVIRREIELEPERPLDTTALERSRGRIEDTRLFSRDPLASPRLTIQPEKPESPGQRDVLVEVKETNTGSISAGVVAGSDGGLRGLLSLEQRNFDLTDTPDSPGELFSGRAFRGGGQTLNLTLSPGDQVEDYSLSLTEPSFLGSNYSASGSVFYRQREFDQYDEERFGTRLGVGRRFGTRWTGNAVVRIESINLGNIESSAPVDVFAVQDQNILTGLGFELVRTTVPPGERFRPSRGTRLELGAEQVGALGGDFNFTKLRAEHVAFLTLRESFEGYRTILSLTTRANYIPQDVDDVPVYERYYLGGQSFRGFDFRAVSPIGIRNDTGTLGDDPVGGTWSFFFGPEVQQPVFSDVVSVAGFVDTGTVLNELGFDNYRVSAGVGLRIFIRQLSPVPLAFDFAVPVVSQDTDKERLFTFSLDLPF